MKTRKLNINDIKKDEWYNLPEIALMLGLHHSTLTRKCHNKSIKSVNIGTEKKATFRVQGKELLNYLNK